MTTSRQPSPKRNRRQGTGRAEKPLLLAAGDRNPAALNARFQTAIKRGRPLCVDASAVDELSTAAVQVLLSAALLAQKRELTFRVVAASRPVIDAFVELGLDEWLEAWRNDADTTNDKSRGA